MSAYLIFNYSVTNPDGYTAYLAAAPKTMAGSGAEVVVADYASEPKEGAPGQVTIVLRFESKEAANAWFEGDAYQAVKHLRTDNSEGAAVLCDGFVMPG